MTARLTSVRLEESVLEQLKLLADVNDTNIAAEIRRAIEVHLRNELGAAEFPDRLRDAQAKQNALMARLSSGSGSD